AEPGQAADEGVGLAVAAEAALGLAAVGVAIDRLDCSAEQTIDQRPADPTDQGRGHDPPLGGGGAAEDLSLGQQEQGQDQADQQGPSGCGGGAGETDPAGGAGLDGPATGDQPGRA